MDTKRKKEIFILSTQIRMQTFLQNVQLQS